MLTSEEHKTGKACGQPRVHPMFVESKRGYEDDNAHIIITLLT